MRTYATSDTEESTTAGEESCPASDDDADSTCSDSEDPSLLYEDHPEDIYDACITAQFDLLRADGAKNEHHSGSALAAADVHRSIRIPVSLDSNHSAGTPHSYAPYTVDTAAERVPMVPSVTGSSNSIWVPMVPCASAESNLNGTREPMAPCDSDKTTISSSYHMPVERHRPRRHRTKIMKQPLFPFPAAVARPVNKAEIAITPWAQEAMQKEWDRLTSK